VTVHVYYEHKCAGCQAFYIPYAPGVACPKCGRQESEVFDFIPQAVASLRFNLMTYGSYLPPAWYAGSLGDHCLRLLFAAFEAYRTRPDQAESFADCLERKLTAMEWGEQVYMLGHLRDIALKVRAVLEESPS
jgi:hypothetical protein